MYIMTNKTYTNNYSEQDPEKVKVLVNLDEQVIPMADHMTKIRDFDNRSVYIRSLIKEDYRRHLRRQQRQDAKLAGK